MLPLWGVGGDHGEQLNNALVFLRVSVAMCLFTAIDSITKTMWSIIIRDIKDASDVCAMGRWMADRTLR